MSKFMYNGKPYGGSTNYASSVACTDAKGNESTVQAEIDKNRDDIDELNKKVGSLIKRETLTKTPDAKGNMLLKSNNIIPLFIIVTSVKNEVFLHKFASYNGYPYARLYDSNNNVITTQITFDLYYLEL